MFSFQGFTCNSGAVSSSGSSRHIEKVEGSEDTNLLVTHRLEKVNLEADYDE
jgi:hypothetical protein